MAENPPYKLEGDDRTIFPIKMFIDAPTVWLNAASDAIPYWETGLGLEGAEQKSALKKVFGSMLTSRTQVETPQVQSKLYRGGGSAKSPSEQRWYALILEKFNIDKYIFKYERE
jgi:hypothetical protein